MYFKKKDKEIEEIMDELTEKISKFLKKNPNSNARRICKEVGADKKAVNSCLYKNLGSHFLKEGLTPPLWRNINDSLSLDTAKTGLSLIDEIEAEEEFRFEVKESDQTIDEDLTRLNAEDQETYLEIKTCIALGVKISEEDSRRMSQLIDKIRQSEGSETHSVEKQE